MIFYEFHLVLLGFTGFKWVYWVLGNLLSMNGLLVFGFFLFQNDRFSFGLFVFFVGVPGKSGSKKRRSRRSDYDDDAASDDDDDAAPVSSKKRKKVRVSKKKEKKKKKRFPLILYLIGFFIYFFKFLPGLPSLFCFFLWCYGSDFTVYFEFHWVFIFHWNLTEFYWVLPSFPGFYRMLPSFTGFYPVLPSFT